MKDITKKEKIRKLFKWILPSLALLIGIMLSLQYLISLNFCLFIGIGMTLMGVLSICRSIVAEMEIKKYSGPDIFSAIAMVIFGIVFMDTSAASFLLACFPILALVIGFWLSVDSLLSRFVKKKPIWIEFYIGMAYLALGTILCATSSFGSYNALLAGVSVVLYGVYLFRKTVTTASESIEVEKIQEEYDIK